jgi:hypothetical protein
MKVAVVIPAYNAADTIVQTIKSVLDQTYDNLEVVVVDDGSTDGTAAIAEARLSKSRRPFVVLRQENRGVSAARNVGWRSTDAPWISFVDADDYIVPHRTEHQLRGVSGLDDHYAAVHSAWQRAYWRDGVFEPFGDVMEAQIDGRPPAVIMIGGNAILPQLVRRSWLEAVNGFDESMKVYEDLDIQVRIAVKGGLFKTVHSDEPLYYWRHVLGQTRVGGAAARYEAGLTARSFLATVRRALDGKTMIEAGLTEQEHGALVASCTHYMRLLFVADRNAFRQELTLLDQATGKFLPSGPPHLRKLAKMLGYEKAESVARSWRVAKSALMPAQGM